ncbi:MAG: hypothetical protein V1731_01275 [Candidatus Aenigmatarchaeota archaeon]
MSKVYFLKEFSGFAEGFIPQNREDVWKNCAPRLMMCYVDPDKPGGRAALTVKSMDNVINSVQMASYGHLRSVGLGIEHHLGEERSPDGRYSARLEIEIGKFERGFLEKSVGKISMFSTKSGYNKEVSCDPAIIRDVNDFVEELEALANADNLLDEIAFNGGF